MKFHRLVSVLFVISFFFIARPVASAASFEFTHDLYFGLSTNPDVQTLQQFLKDNSFYDGPMTGGFFSLTQGAVKKFQTAHGIKPTGYFGPQSRAAANQASGKMMSSESPTGSREAQIAMIKNQLEALIRELNLLLAVAPTSTPVVATTTAPAPSPIPPPAPLPPPVPPNPFESHLKIQVDYPSLTLSHYSDVTLNLFRLTDVASEKIAVKRIKFMNSGSLSNFYPRQFRLVNMTTGDVLATVPDFIQTGTIEFVLTSDPTKPDHNLMVPGNFYSVLSTILTPQGLRGTIRLDILTANDIDAVDYNDLSRVAHVTAENVFPVIGPLISTF